MGIHVGNFNMKLTGRWFPQIVDREWESISNIYIQKIVVLVFLFAGDLRRPSCLVFLLMIF